MGRGEKGFVRGERRWAGPDQRGEKEWLGLYTVFVLSIGFRNSSIKSGFLA